MARRPGRRGAQPFLSGAEQQQFDLLGEHLAGTLVDRPDNAPPLDLPAEWLEYQFARHMGWSSAELDACPIWRKQQWIRFMAAERTAETRRAKGDRPLSPLEREQQAEQAQDEIAAARARHQAREAAQHAPPDDPT